MSLPHHRAFHSIQTPRLLIRSIVPEDVDFLLALRTSPLNHTYLNMESDLTADILQVRQKQWIDEASKGVRAKMVVVIRQDGEADDGSTVNPVIGVSGINRFVKKPDVDDPAREAFTADVGVIIDSKFGGKGYGYEAIKAVIEYCFDEMKAEQIFIETRTRNKPMMNVMEKLGLAHLGKVIPLKINNEDGFDTLFSKRMWDEAQNAKSSS